MSVLRSRSRRSRTRPATRDLQAAVDAFRRIIRCLRLAEHATRAEVGLSAAQLFVLRQVESAPSTSLSDLAQRTLTDRTSVADVVERLVDGGMVTTERDAADRRRVLVRISRAGRALLRTAPPAPTTLLVEALERMPAAARHQLVSRLRMLVAEMGLEGEPAMMLFEDAPAPKTRGR